MKDLKAVLLGHCEDALKNQRSKIANSVGEQLKPFIRQLEDMSDELQRKNELLLAQQALSKQIMLTQTMVCKTGWRDFDSELFGDGSKSDGTVLSKPNVCSEPCESSFTEQLLHQEGKAKDGLEKIFSSEFNLYGGFIRMSLQDRNEALESEAARQISQKIAKLKTQLSERDVAIESLSNAISLTCQQGSKD